MAKCLNIISIFTNIRVQLFIFDFSYLIMFSTRPHTHPFPVDFIYFWYFYMRFGPTAVAIQLQPNLTFSYFEWNLCIRIHNTAAWIGNSYIILDFGFYFMSQPAFVLRAIF